MEPTEKWVNDTLSKGVNELSKEFGMLKRYVPPGMQTDTFTSHRKAGRNRYIDVPCQDKFRVVLKWPKQEHDYIHANYVATPTSEKRFICTQGPLDSTTTDFWHMIIQEESDSVIMLCNCKEKGMDKCAQYWPVEENETKTFGDVEITNISVRPMAPEETSVRLSVLNMKWMENDVKKERELRHYQWIDWPDHGVPPCSLAAMNLLFCVRETKKPITVHCSAGIGRTGTIVAIEFILERLQSGLPCEATDEILKKLRNQRPYSIQTSAQYLFVHRVMLFYFFEKCKVGHTAENQALYEKFVDEYEKATTYY